MNTLTIFNFEWCVCSCWNYCKFGKAGSSPFARSNRFLCNDIYSILWQSNIQLYVYVYQRLCLYPYPWWHSILICSEQQHGRCSTAKITILNVSVEIKLWCLWYHPLLLQQPVWLYSGINHAQTTGQQISTKTALHSFLLHKLLSVL